MVHDIDAWIGVDPDPVTRGELERLVAAGDQGTLEELFGARLLFGTAGIRGAQGPGPNRMNRVTVRHMAAGVAAHLGSGTAVVIGFDARPNSDLFAQDAAAVCAASGIRALLIPEHVPTPVLAYAVRALGVDLGLMVTASHNPPADNGCKVFLSDGAQLRSPIDAAIEAHIDAAPLPPRDLPVPADGGAVEAVPMSIVDDYVAAVVAAVPTAVAPVSVAYTPLHGVGNAVFAAAFDAAGAAPPAVVTEQAEPDGSFPTVPFPNPEEPGAMDAVIALAQREGAQLAIANDPDADRLAVAVPVADGSWRALTGDEVGALLVDDVLRRTDGPARKVVSTVVCSSLVGTMAMAAGVVHAETLTGFKWIIAEAYADPDTPPVFAYEESLGYACTPEVRDKDGISAALWFVALTAELAERGQTPAGRLDELAVEHGLHATRQVSVRFDGPAALAQAGAAVEALRSDPPAEVAGRAVVGLADYAEGGALPPTNLLRFDLDGGIRVLVRPSGTEPKTKLYLEQITEVDSVAEVPAARTRSLALLDDLAQQFAASLQRG